AATPTLMIVEAVEPVPWTKPADLPYGDGRPVPELGGQFEDGSYVAVADGSIRFLSRRIAPETLRALITPRRRAGGSPWTALAQRRLRPGRRPSRLLVV